MTTRRALARRTALAAILAGPVAVRPAVFFDDHGDWYVLGDGREWWVIR